MIRSVLEFVRCPRCGAGLDLRAATISCTACRRSFPRLGQIPVLFVDPDAYLCVCRRQLFQLEHRLTATARAIEEQLQAPDILPETRTRCRGLVEGAQAQVDDIRAILTPLLPADPAGLDSRGADDDNSSLLAHVSYLFRDWAWPADQDGENERAFALLQAVIEGRDLGNALVLGAGACRLAYDLHRRCSTGETVVVDIDPLLFAVAHTVIRGGSVLFREGYADINELGNTFKEWRLAAVHGPLDEQRFHFLLADAIEPPFLDATFDTLVTPWFVDAIPADLCDSISTIHRLLKPGGHWINWGPLRYGANVPVLRRFTREESFALMQRAGFSVDKWETASVPYLVSKQTGRGKVEWVVSFSATKLDAVPDDRADLPPPSWVLFRHVPIRPFPGQALFWDQDSFNRLVVSLIDGRRTLDDIAAHVASQTARQDVSRSQIRAAVRQSLLRVHSALREHA